MLKLIQINSNIKRILFVLFFSIFLFAPWISFATHNRAGEITFEQIEGFRYKITIITYTNTKPPSTGQLPADRSSLQVYWGDNTYSEIPRVDKVYLGDNFQYNKYEGEHVYPGPGVYQIVMSDPYRNEDVSNVPTPLSTLFTLKTTLNINNQLGNNKAPLLLYPPTDKAALNQKFIHNPGAYDPDGDSLSYSITSSRAENGMEIPGYQFPPASDSLYVNSITGDLVWDKPSKLGTYNIAMEITEWRMGVAISRILRDIQIEVVPADNNPPVNNVPANSCIIAGDSIKIPITSSDPDGDIITQEVFGGAVDSNHINDPAIYTPPSEGPSVTGFLNWKTKCSHIRKQPYEFLIKAQEVNGKEGSAKLFDLDKFNLTVIGPPVQNLRSESFQDGIQLNWDPPVCESNLSFYKVYRRFNNESLPTDPCLIGIPPSSGYMLIHETESADVNSFYDSDSTLKRGVLYCYRIVPVYGEINLVDGKASVEICETLPPGTPAFTKTSVIESHPTEGKIMLEWIIPHEKTSILPGPFKYKLYRKDTGNDNFNLLKEWETNLINDSSYVDSMINTVNFPYKYKLELYHINNSLETLIGFSETTSSTFMSYKGADGIVKIEIINNVPWLDTMFVIYRYNEINGKFDSIGYTNNNFYIDKNLVNLEEYTYRVISKGWREYDSIYYSTTNISHDLVAIPLDTVPPCPPVLVFESRCKENFNLLSWTNIEDSCAIGITGYNIYYSDQINSNMKLIKSIKNGSETSFTHIPELSLGACYAITALDSFKNESKFSNLECIDSCSYYKLPNVFTPDEDDIFDLYKSENLHNYVKEVDMKIFNRYGSLVYETTDPEINWNGENKNTKKLCSSGVYYYICTIYEKRITGSRVTKTLTGFIHLYSNKTQLKKSE
ncbi:MAG: gliding motility-associated C-terminal domain-containing protein [bacterium]